jgi:predicted MFS family arabinose efflux permease
LFVAALAVLAAISVLVFVPIVPRSPALGLQDRLAPLGDARVVTTLASSVLVIFGAFLIYNYVSVIFDRATGGDGMRLASLLSIWGAAATVGSLASGSLADRFGNRRIINLAIVPLILDFALMPWSGAQFANAALALTIWGVCGCGFVVAQQHRLVSIAPALSPILLGLNASALHLGVSLAGAGGALAMRWLPAHELPLLSAAAAVTGGLAAEIAHRCILNVQPRPATSSPTASIWHLNP